MALGCLCTPEYMPSICLLYGFEMALGGLPPFLVQGSRFKVQRSTFSLRPEPQTQESRLPARRRLEAPPVGSKLSTASVRRVSGETPMSLPGIQRRFGLCNWASSAPLVAKRASRPELRIEGRLGTKPDGMGAVAKRSGVGPGAVPCGSCKALTARHLQR
jgi:hypothetical protein